MQICVKATLINLALDAGKQNHNKNCIFYFIIYLFIYFI